MTAIGRLLEGPGGDRDLHGETARLVRLDLEAVRQVVVQLRDQRERLDERELDQRPVACEAPHVDVRDAGEPAERALERGQCGKVSEGPCVELDAAFEALPVLGAAPARWADRRGAV